MEKLCLILLYRSLYLSFINFKNPVRLKDNLEKKMSLSRKKYYNNLIIHYYNIIKNYNTLLG